MRQFGHFVEENSSSVALLEIPFAALRSAGKSALFMPEQFGIDRTFRDSAAIHCNVIAVFPGTVGMDNLRKNLFPDTAFAGNQH